MLQSEAAPLGACPPTANPPPRIGLQRLSLLLLRGQGLLQELFYLVDISLHVPIEGQKRRMRARSEVVQVRWLSVERVRFR